MHRRETPPEASKEHTDCSTKKNRELLLLKLPLYAVSEVIFHSKEKMDELKETTQQAFSEACKKANMGAGVLKISHSPHIGTCDGEFYPEKS